MRIIRSRRLTKKGQSLKRRSFSISMKILAIVYLLFYTASYFSSTTTAYFNDIERVHGSLSAKSDFGDEWGKSSLEIISHSASCEEISFTVKNKGKAMNSEVDYEIYYGEDFTTLTSEDEVTNGTIQLGAGDHTMITYDPGDYAEGPNGTYWFKTYQEEGHPGSEQSEANGLKEKVVLSSCGENEQLILDTNLEQGLTNNMEEPEDTQVTGNSAGHENGQGRGNNNGNHGGNANENNNEGDDGEGSNVQNGNGEGNNEGNADVEGNTGTSEEEGNTGNSDDETNVENTNDESSGNEESGDPSGNSSEDVDGNEGSSQGDSGDTNNQDGNQEEGESEQPGSDNQGSLNEDVSTQDSGDDQSDEDQTGEDQTGEDQTPNQTETNEDGSGNGNG